MSALQKLTGSASTVAVVCNQWGDTGKGKFVDVLAEWADVIARGTGGANAGHTIHVGDKKHVFHLLPSGILYDHEGKWNIVGGGTALDPRVVIEELAILESEKISYKNLLIAQNAKLVLPQHIVLDRVRESAAKKGFDSPEHPAAAVRIGTTGRGIGPVYADYYARLGLCTNDLLNIEIFKKKLERNLREKLLVLRQYDPAVIKEVMHHPHLQNGRFWNEQNIFDVEAILETYKEYGKRLGDMIADTEEFMHKARAQGRKILLEGAQGNLLSVDIGTYPYVTSSDCSMRGLVQGVGLRERDVDLCLGIVRGFYMTRVGEGPFPTELGGTKSAEWCGKGEVTKVVESKEFPEASVNDKDPFLQGVGMRKAGNEYGATTGRPRRTGWLDIPLLRYSMEHSGPEAIFTKLDVLDECEEIKICTKYDYQGPEYRWGKTLFHPGMTLDKAVPDPELLGHCVPIYESFPGWKESISGIREYKAMPAKLKTLVSFVEKAAGLRVRALSVGPDREQTIVRE
ncbi:MAG: adenylosuccinate synthase [Candidatus Liptonbacteria bacterium]|nr:adenylosuccinate synthase [Candidatus Liptonbacteria bacterium]